MKRLVSVLVAVMLVVSVTAQAMAYFEESHLIQVVYHDGGMTEVATDLGPMADYLTPGEYDFQNVDLADFPGATWADLRVAYIHYDDNTDDVHFSGQDVLKSGNRKWATFTGAANPMSSYYGSLGGPSVVAEQSNANSYWTRMDKSGNAIGLAAEFLASGNIEASLAAIGTTGYVTQQLYFFDSPNSAVDGTLTGVTLVTSEVPLPASVLLLGSGLLGLVGIARKKRNI